MGKPDVDWHPYCGSHAKLCYPSRKAARRRIRTLGNDPRMSVYRCEEQPGWHVGHTPLVGRGSRMADWDAIPRMLSERCEGCGQVRAEVYRQEYPSGAVLWECKSCWVRNRRTPGGS